MKEFCVGVAIAGVFSAVGNEIAVEYKGIAEFLVVAFCIVRRIAFIELADATIRDTAVETSARFSTIGTAWAAVILGCTEL